MDILRIIIGGALALALSGISITCCYVFGSHLAPGREGELYGVLGATADALKAILPLAIAAALSSKQWARAAIAILLFLVFSAYSFASEIGLYALSRDAGASEAAASQTRFDLVKDERARIQERLTALGQMRPSRTIEAELTGRKTSSAWSSSKECTDAQRAPDRTFCKAMAALQGELASAEEAEQLRAKDESLARKLDDVNLGEALKDKDSQAKALANMTGIPASQVKDGLAVLVAILIELGSGLGLYAATVRGRRQDDYQDDFSSVLPQVDAIKRTVLACSDRLFSARVDEPTDPVEAFVEAMLVRRSGCDMTAAEMGAAFATWAKREGREQVSPAMLGRRLTALKYIKVKRGGVVYYQGVTLRAAKAPAVNPQRDPIFAPTHLAIAARC